MFINWILIELLICTRTLFLGLTVLCNLRYFFNIFRFESDSSVCMRTFAGCLYIWVCLLVCLYISLFFTCEFAPLSLSLPLLLSICSRYRRQKRRKIEKKTLQFFFLKHSLLPWQPTWHPVVLSSEITASSVRNRLFNMLPSQSPINLLSLLPSPYL